jgi:hypothetical protein
VLVDRALPETIQKLIKKSSSVSQPRCNRKLCQRIAAFKPLQLKHAKAVDGFQRLSDPDAEAG